MRISVKLVSLEHISPPGFDAFGAGAMTLEPGATLADLLGRLSLPGDEAYMTLVNDDAVAISGRNEHRLADGDQVTVFPPIKGG